jgi:hypothetical protein
MFARLRDDADRTDVVAGLAFAAGIAASLAVGGDDLRDLDVLDSLVWLFVSGLSLGFALYWVAGWGLAFVVRRLGGSGEGRLARHVLAFSFVPLVFAIAVWLIWPPLLLVLAVCSFALLLVGLRQVYAWSWARAGSAVGLAALWLGALGVCLLSVLVLLGRLGE